MRAKRARGLEDHQRFLREESLTDRVGSAGKKQQEERRWNITDAHHARWWLSCPLCPPQCHGLHQPIPYHRRLYLSVREHCVGAPTTRKALVKVQYWASQVAMVNVDVTSSCQKCPDSPQRSFHQSLPVPWQRCQGDFKMCWRRELSQKACSSQYPSHHKTHVVAK